ncbi:MAG: hypothetical protein K2Q20_14825 [Phycisphaerales bacterium]|nr:hypothetical protein [Phycisphaerales bacterium]
MSTIKGSSAGLKALTGVPAAGTRLVELDTGKEKVGDGVKTFAALEYAAGALASGVSGGGGGGGGDVPSTRSIIAGTGLSGGGDLSADRTLSVSFGNTGSTVCVGNDSRLSNARTPTSHTHATSEITGLDTALAGKAASSHTHATSEITGLDTALAGKAASSHTHTTSQVTGPSLAASRLLIGVAETNVGADSSAGTNSALFRYSTSASDSGWVCCTTNGTTQTTSSAVGPAVATNTVYFYAIDMRDPSKVDFYLGTTEEGMSLVHSATGTLPGVNTYISPTASITTLENVAKTLSLGSHVWSSQA